MEIDPGLKQEPSGSDHSEHSTVASPPNPSIASLLPLEGDDSLTLLPEVQATGRPAGSKRPFQRRRRSRACDACRARKTKCDTPDHGSCSACVSASLVCKFSGGEDRRRAGPARRVRALECTVQELTRKLAEAEAKIQHLALSGSEAGSLTERPPHSPINSDFNITSPRFGGASSNNELRLPRSSPKNEAFGESGGFGVQQKGSGGRHERFENDGTSWDHHIFGPSSCPSFLHSYNDYLSRLGYRPPPASNPTMNTGGPPSPNPNTRIPNPSAPNKFIPFDLRALLPPLKLAKQMIEVFRKTVQNYTPIFYWPNLEKRIVRAWEIPIWDSDNEAVRSVFCVIMMLLAVSSQFIELGEIDEPEGGDWAHEQDSRNGWMFFECGRKYSNLNNPDYTIDDAIYLLLMALYLDKAFLPSPCWMITGAMARVCQDIGIYRRTPAGLYDEVEVECRTRLFWVAYIQDRKISMKLGRPVIFLDQHIDVGLPGFVGSKGKNMEENDQGSQNDKGNQAPPKSPGVDAIQMDNEGSSEEVMGASLQVFKATIYIAQASEVLLNIELKKSGGEEDIKHLQNIDEMLKNAWEVFPSEMTDLTRSDVLDLPAVRPLFHLQHSRIILYRYFTDFTGTPSLTREFRTFCLAQSIQVAKITSHILSRVVKNPGFDRIFGLRADELVIIHTFRAATVLLLGHYCNDHSLLSVSNEEVSVCARALKSCARSCSLGQKLLELFQNFARMFGYQTGISGELLHPIPEAGDDAIDEKTEDTHDVSTTKGPWDSAESSNVTNQPYTSGVYGEYQSLPGNTPRWIPTTSISLVPTYQQLLHSNQTLHQPPLSHPQSQSHGHHETHAGMIFVDPGMGSSGLPTAVVENCQGTIPDHQGSMLHQIDWDVYQQMLTFDPNFEVYMGGPRHALYDRGE